MPHPHDHSSPSATVGSHAVLLAVLALPLLLASGCGGMLGARGERGEDLRIRKVVLFQNGVGYFERRGTIAGDRFGLHVRPDQINDVLKSLTILNLSGGRTSSVTLPVERSADRLAAELPAAVRDARGLEGLLQVLRGVEVTVHTRDDDVRGRVVGVEGGGKGSKDGKRVTLLRNDRELVALPIDKVREVKIHDRALASGLARSLDISKGDGQWKPVSLTVHLDGDGGHDLLVGYIHEVPIWRPAYRAWVEKGHGVRLQGWAVVDNVSGEHWKDVRLSLVVGSPLSFRYELHKPHHVQRPDLSSRLPQTAVAPPPPDVGYAKEEEAYAGAPMADSAGEMAPVSKKSMLAGPSRSMARPAAPRPAPAMEPDVDVDTRRRALDTARAMAEGRKMGQLYAYDALAPVTVDDGQAALVHIVDRKVEGGDVFLFRNPQANEAPYRSLLVRNGKEGALETGPITLYVDGNFAGEGFLGRIDAGATTFIPFAAADGFTLTTQVETRTADVKLVRAHGGVLTIEARRRLIHSIKLRNERDEPALCFVKMQLHGGMTLEAEPKGLVRAGDEVYLPVQVGAKAEGKAELVEVSRISTTQTWLSGMVIEAFELIVKDGSIADAVKGPVKQLLALNDALSRLQRQRDEAAKRRQELEVEAQRIRNNLDALPLDKVADGLRKTLVAQLDANSRAAAEAAKTIVELDVQMAATREKMTALIKELELK